MLPKHTLRLLCSSWHCQNTFHQQGSPLGFGLASKSRPFQGSDCNKFRFLSMYVSNHALPLLPRVMLYLTTPSFLRPISSIFSSQGVSKDIGQMRLMHWFFLKYQYLHIIFIDSTILNLLLIYCTIIFFIR